MRTSRRWLLIAGVLAIGGVWGLGMYAYMTAHDGTFPAAVGIGLEGGIPRIVHARCGVADPIGSVDLRQAPPGWDYPRSSDPRVFDARATGAASSTVEVAPEVPGYLIEAYEPLSSDTDYYIYALTSPEGVNALPVAQRFRTSDLAEGQIATVYNGNSDLKIGAQVPADDWVPATSC